jgi:TatD DNase family protein
LVIHSREATEEALEILESIAHPNLKGVFHCWAGSTEQAQRAINLGFVIGIGGTVTYKNSNLPEVLKPLGYENIILETDTPYLPPVPYRGKPNEPAYIKHVAYKIAEIFETDVDEIAKKTTENCLNLFKNVTIVPKPLNFAE